MIRRLADRREVRSLDLVAVSERIRWCDWAGERHLLCGTIAPVRGRDRVTERTRLYAIEAQGGRVRELNTRLTDPVRDQVVDFLSHRGPHVLVQYDETGRGFPVVAELDVASGALRELQNARPPIRRWMGDGSGRVQLGIGYEDGMGSLWVPSQTSTSEWRKLVERPISDIDTIAPLAFGASHDELYVLKHHAGRTALFRLRLPAPESHELLFAHARYDVSGPLVLGALTRSLLSVRYLGERETQHVFDEGEASLQRWLDAQMPNRANRVVSRTWDGRRQLIESASDLDPPSLLRRSANELPRLARLWRAFRGERHRAVGRRHSQRHYRRRTLAGRAGDRRSDADLYRGLELWRLRSVAGSHSGSAVVCLCRELRRDQRPAGAVGVRSARTERCHLAGATWSDRQALWQMSPMARVRTVEVPTLIVHGREDPVVPYTQSRRFARELRGAGKVHRYLERIDCDHEMTIESCRGAFYAELRGFLHAALGARAAN